MMVKKERVQRDKNLGDWHIGTKHVATPLWTARMGGMHARIWSPSLHPASLHMWHTWGYTHSERRLRLPALLAGEDWRALAGMRRMTLGGGWVTLGVPAPGVSAMLPSDSGSSLYETEADARVLGVSMSIGNEVGVSVETCWSSWDIGGGWFWRLREEGAEPGGGVSKAAVDSARRSTVGPFGVPARLAGSGLMSIGA